MVIDIIKIKRPVHLIPKFGSEIGATVEVKRDLDCTLSKRKLVERDVSCSSEKNEVVDAMSHYREFWLNTWIDPDIYKRIY
jgi:hypothetical protein